MFVTPKQGTACLTLALVTGAADMVLPSFALYCSKSSERSPQTPKSGIQCRKLDYIETVVERLMVLGFETVIPFLRPIEHLIRDDSISEPEFAFWHPDA